MAMLKSLAMKAAPVLCSFIRISSAFAPSFPPRTLRPSEAVKTNAYYGLNHPFMSLREFSEELSNTSMNFAIDPDSEQARSITEALGVTAEQHETLCKHSDLIVEWNDRLNLISRKDCNREVVFGRHILPSLALGALPNFPVETSDGETAKAKIVDVGTGGGFPGVPLAIMYPDCDFLLVDSVGKKLQAIEAMVEELGLENVSTHHGRAEEIVDDPVKGRKQKNSFDICVGRSVTSLPRFCFWIQDLLKKNKDEEGRLVYIIGGDVEESVTSRLDADVAIDDLLQFGGVSDKRTLILSASNVVKIAKESGEKREIRGSSKKNKKNRKPRSNDDGVWNASKGAWSKKDNSLKKQRGYENFKRYGSN